MPRAGAPHPILHWQFGTTSNGYDLEAIFKVADTHRVRVRIHVDAYRDQSYARAEVLTPEMTWTQIASEFPTTWFGSVPSYAVVTECPQQLDPIVDRLLDAAERILTA